VILKVSVVRSSGTYGEQALPAAVQGRRGRVVPDSGRGDDRVDRDDLGVNRETLRSWVRADDERRGVGSGSARSASTVGEASGSVEQENADLRRRVRQLEEERDILGKGAWYFAGETRW
jgi:transposase